MATSVTGLKRELNPMPADVRDALQAHGLREAYDERPAYQRNDYLGWITRAQRQGTRDKRIQQMQDELRRGDVYMNMAWRRGKVGA